MARKAESTIDIEAPPRGAGGRPPKFAEPRRPVTVTLPERTLDALSRIDVDRARAIVKLADGVRGSSGEGSPVEVVAISSDAAVVLVGFSASLAKIPWLRQIEIVPGRHLLSVEPGTPIDSLEVALVDLLEGGTSARDRAIIEELLSVVRSQRRDRAMTKEEILVIRRARPRRRR